MDAILAIRTILLSDTVPGGIVSLVGQNVYGGQLPEHYNPEVESTAEPAGDGPAITLIIKGGTSHYEIPMQEVDLQLAVWAGINENQLARQVYERAYQVLDGLCNQNLGGAGRVIRIHANTPAQDNVDPDTGWVMMLSVFGVLIADTGAYPVDVVISPPETAAQYTDAAIAAIDGVDGGFPGENFS
jgi:hypothetical protein